MKVSFGADLAALVATEIEREMLKRGKNQMLAAEQANEKLVADFLEADDNKNFDAQKDMLGDIEAAMNPGAGGNGNMLAVIEAAMNSGNMLAAIEAAMNSDNMLAAIDAAMNHGAGGEGNMPGAIEAAMNPGAGDDGNMLGAIEAAMNPGTDGDGNMLGAIEAAMNPGAGRDGNMVGAIAAAMNPGTGFDGNNAQGSGGDYGGKINIQNLDEEVVNMMATIEGTNGGGE
ncbi:hypothetical protein REPUB_Repub16aG0098200 [Reevesia pubescens]